MAGEVKALASQTARAAEEISRHVLGVQESSTGVSSAFKEVADTIRLLDSVAADVAAVMEAQAVMTKDISANIQSAARSVGASTASVGEISEMTQRANDRLPKLGETSRSMVA